MKIRVLYGFAGYEAGQVFEDWPDGMCDIFIAKRLIEKVEDSPAIEAADEEPEVERAEMPARRKRK